MRTLLLLLCLSTSMMFGQQAANTNSLEFPKLGATLGIGMGKMGVDAQNQGVDFDAWIPVYKLGLIYDVYNINQLHFLGELNYGSQGGGGSINGENEFTMRFNYLNLSALAEYQIQSNNAYYVAGGFNVGFFLGGQFKDKESGDTQDLDQVQSTMMSLKLKGGTLVNLFDKPTKVGLDFSLGLSNTNTDEQDGVTKLHSIMLEIIYPIF